MSYQKHLWTILQFYTIVEHEHAGVPRKESKVTFAYTPSPLHFYYEGESEKKFTSRGPMWD